MSVRAALQSTLSDAMRRRDMAAVRAVRTAMAAIANAEALPGTDTGGHPSAHIAVAHSFAEGAAEAPRRALSEDQQRQLVTDEIAELSAHAEQLEATGRLEQAATARRGADALAEVLSRSDSLP